jgi:N-acetylneuraminic acid mutarotase
VNEQDLDHLDAADGSPTNAVYVDNNGNVGIGTPSPQQKLEVNGGIRLNATTSEPICNDSLRGTLWFNRTSTGDALDLCKYVGLNKKQATLSPGRLGLSCATHMGGNSIFCFGGWSNMNVPQIVEYSTSTDTLINKSSTLPGATRGLSCVGMGWVIWCFGGYLSDQILEYLVLYDSLTIKGAKLPTPRAFLSCAEDFSTLKIYCFGGGDTPGAGGTLYNEILEYDIYTGSIVTKTAVLPTGRRWLSCAEDSSTHKIYCFGGLDATGYLNQIVEYTPASDSLVVKTATLPSGRFGLSCEEKTSVGKIYCFGGYGGDSQVVEYTPSTDSITVAPPILTPGRVEHSCVENLVNNKIYCFGGWSGYYSGEIVEATLSPEWVRIANP